MSVPVEAPRLHLQMCRNKDERRFFERLDQRATDGGWFADSWPHASGHVIISICTSDSERKCILRTLRADYVGPHLLLGNDQTHQFVTDLDPARPGVTLVPDGGPEELANIAADWFELEMSRPIAREEWFMHGETRERCVLVDSGQVLTLQGKWNAAARQTPGMPDKRTIVWPGNRGTAKGTRRTAT